MADGHGVRGGAFTLLLRATGDPVPVPAPSLAAGLPGAPPVIITRSGTITAPLVAAGAATAIEAPDAAVAILFA